MRSVSAGIIKRTDMLMSQYAILGVERPSVALTLAKKVGQQCRRD